MMLMGPEPRIPWHPRTPFDPAPSPGHGGPE